jgi:CheY-like chemotaxis protein
MCKTIMIIDNEQSFHELYSVMLEGTGYEIIRAYHGGEAMFKLERKKPDLIILDILIDMMTGDTFIQNLKSMREYANIPVIIISSFLAQVFKNLKQITPNLVFLEKTYLTKKRLLDEINKELNGKAEARIE